MVAPEAPAPGHPRLLARCRDRVVAVVGLITLFSTIARNVAICVAGVNC